MPVKVPEHSRPRHDVRQVKALTLTVAELENALLRHVPIVGVPDDARIVAVEVEASRNTVTLYLHHPAYPVVPDGGHAPGASLTTHLCGPELNDMEERRVSYYEAQYANPAIETLNKFRLVADGPYYSVLVEREEDGSE